MEVNLNDFDSKIDKILDEKKYSNELKNIFKQIAVAMLCYYGEERAPEILNVFSHTYIYVANIGENPRDFIKKYFSVPVRYSQAENSLAACYLWHIIPDGDDVKFESLIYIPKKINYLNPNFQHPLFDYCLQTLIHEINHCVKTNGYYERINDTVFKIASGINHTIYDTKTFPYTILDDKFDALEEAINTIQEYDLFTILTGREPIIAGTYKNSAEFLQCLFKNLPNLYEIVVKSQFDKTNDWINAIGEENAKKIDAIFRKEHKSEESVLKEGTPEYDEFIAIWIDLVQNMKIK